MAGTQTLLEANGYEFRPSLLSGPYSSLMKVDVVKVDARGKLRTYGSQRIFGIGHTSEVVRVGFFRKKIATLHFDPVTTLLSIEE